MIRAAIGVAVFFGVAAVAAPALAQTADEVIERSVTALGGRAAHAKVTSRQMTGTITLATPAGEIGGSIEILSAVPNKTRSLIKADLSALGVGELVLDQRFDGQTGYALDSLQGNRDITGNQLDNLRNGAFPHPFLNYKELGIAVKLEAPEKIDGRDMFVITFDPPSGSTIRQYIDAQTFLPVRMRMAMDVPQIGQQIEQTTDFFDYREVDGIKIPFQLKASSSVQNFSIAFRSIEHNVKIDAALFAKPAGR